MERNHVLRACGRLGRDLRRTREGGRSAFLHFVLLDT
jgi:hypothetical protein